MHNHITPARWAVFVVLNQAQAAGVGLMHETGSGAEGGPIGQLVPSPSFGA